METKKTIIYKPNMRSQTGFFRTWWIMIRNITESRELIYQLFRRDFLMGWLVIAPLMGIISWVFMNLTGVLNPGDVGIPYPAYVLLSSTVWGLFMGFFNSASGTLDAASGFILQVKFPHDVLLIKQTLQQLVNFTITFLITLIVLLLFGVVPHWKIVFFPLLVLPLFFLGSAIGLVVSVISVVAVDMKRGFGFVMSLLMYVTPVIYSSRIENPTLQAIIKWNPLTYLVGGVRDMIIFGTLEHFDRFIYSAIISFFSFLLAWRLFFVSEDKVIEKMI